MDKNKRQEFKSLVTNAVKDGLSFLLKKKQEPYGYFQWPSLSFWPNGLPHLSEGFGFSGPPDYKRFFEGSDQSFSTVENDSFQKLLSYTKTSDWLLNRILPKETIDSKRNDDISERLLEHLTFRIPLEIIDRYIHINKTKAFQTELFDLIYEPLAQPLFLDKLAGDIYAPILFLKFGFDDVILAENVSINRMDELFHLARFPLQSYGSGVHKSVLSAATHCLVLRNCTITNTDYWSLTNIFTNMQAFPLENINVFFASIRLITGAQTGYSQVLLHPENWALHYKGNLPPLEGTSINTYPPWFENYFWLTNDIPEINEVTAKEIGDLYFDLSHVKENSIHIAVKRLNQCFLREDDQDNILDATIGLESLLSDDNRQEMTHKLAMRMGALAKLEEISDDYPLQVFNEIKKIYSYRSAVVHGSNKTDKNREIVLSDNSKVPTSRLAVDYLRMAIKALIKHPDFRNSAIIDKFLLLSKI